MLCINTRLKKSKISGIGLFAGEKIKKGTVVWKFNPKIDILLSKKEILTLSNPSKKQFYNYAFLDNYYKKFMLCGDDARFFNHSDKPNCNDKLKDITIAIRDIDKDEELTVDYRTFYGELNGRLDICFDEV